MEYVLDFILRIAHQLPYYLPVPLINITIRALARLPLFFLRDPLRWATQPRMEFLPWHKEVTKDSWRGVWIGKGFGARGIDEIEEEMTGGAKAELFMLYIHGGGMRAGHAWMFMEHHVDWINRLQKNHKGLRMRILSVEYGLAPENRYPSSLIEITEAYRYMVETLSIPASKIIIAGDSAGGAFTLSTLYHMHIIGANLPVPHGAICISPMVTLTTTSRSLVTNASTDFIPVSLIEGSVTDYLPEDVETTDPRVSPLFTPAESLPFCLPRKLCLTVGGAEIMRDDIIGFANKVQREAKGTKCVVVEVSDGSHDWVLNPWMIRRENAWEKGVEEVMHWIAGVAVQRPE